MINVILEGPDNAGKTTLAKSLTASIPLIAYHHPGGRPDDAKHELHCMTNQQEILNSGPLHLIDRITAISQQIYNPDEDLNSARLNALKLVLDTKPIIIYCRPSTDKLMRTSEFTWREGESTEHKEKIINNQHRFIQRYDAFMQQVPHISYNYEEVKMSELIITKLLKAYQGDTECINWLNHIMHFKAK